MVGRHILCVVSLYHGAGSRILCVVITVSCGWKSHSECGDHVVGRHILCVVITVSWGWPSLSDHCIMGLAVTFCVWRSCGWPSHSICGDHVAGHHILCVVILWLAVTFYVW